MVFSGLYPVDGDEYPELRDALDKLRLNDASLVYEPETSTALGFGFRCGFLGLLHMEIVRERLEREFDLSLIATAPSVEYRVHLTNGSTEIVDNPAAMQTTLTDLASQATQQQYSSNITTVQAQANSIYSVLQSLQTITSQAKTITTEAGNSTNSQTDLNNYATQVNALMQQALHLIG